jgi:hypothetical protein
VAYTYELIASTTVGSGGASAINFTSIPGTFTDLVLKLSIRSEGTSTTAALLRLNGSSSSGIIKGIEGNGASVSSWNDTSSYAGNIVPGNYTSNTFCNNEIYIPNYTSSSNKHSSVDSVTENNSTIYALQNFQANRWANTAVVTSITISPNGTDEFAEYSTAYLYGIKNS